MVRCSILFVALLLAALPGHGQERNSPAPVLLCFNGPACPSCQAIKPLWANLERKGVKLFPVNIDDSPGMMQVWNVKAIPTSIAVVADDKGAPRELGRIVGMTDQKSLDDLLSKR